MGDLKQVVRQPRGMRHHMPRGYLIAIRRGRDELLREITAHRLMQIEPSVLHQLQGRIRGERFSDRCRLEWSVCQHDAPGERIRDAIALAPEDLVVVDQRDREAGNILARHLGADVAIEFGDPARHRNARRGRERKWRDISRRWMTPHRAARDQHREYQRCDARPSQVYFSDAFSSSESSRVAVFP